MERVPTQDVLITVCDLNEESACTRRFDHHVVTSVEIVPSHDVLITVCDLNGESACTRRFNCRVLPQWRECLHTTF